ncbi:DUF4440 domain-containing protein [Exiguobacterium alkaliphilum]|uniref:nuclear transport factor 2 family protein n=1 Tax=Exiguobacterium alkaliphilum TaxID=1428684 RepID=UPI0034639FCC
MLAPLIEEKERLLLTKEVRTSPERLRELVTEDFFEIGSSGRLLYKEEDTNTMDLGEIDVSLTDFNLEVIRDDVVLATYRTENHMTGKTSLRSSIWVRIDGTWKMKFHQGTPIP